MPRILPGLQPRPKTHVKKNRIHNNKNSKYLDLEPVHPVAKASRVGDGARAMFCSAPDVSNPNNADVLRTLTNMMPLRRSGMVRKTADGVSI